MLNDPMNNTDSLKINDPLKISDFRGRKIGEGTTVKYLRTRTTGKVDKICIREGQGWARLDSTGLYYRADFLEVTKPVEIKNKDSNSPKDKIIQKIARSRSSGKGSPIEISDHPDGAGYGGG
jgi:hypothetical protein